MKDHGGCDAGGIQMKDCMCISLGEENGKRSITNQHQIRRKGGTISIYSSTIKHSENIPRKPLETSHDAQLPLT